MSKRYKRRSRSRSLGRAVPLLAGGVVAAAAVGGGTQLVRSSSPLRIDGPAEGAVVGGRALAGPLLSLVPKPGVDPAAIRATLGDAPARLTADHGALSVAPAKQLSDGVLPLVITVPGGGMFGRTAVIRRTFTVDTTPPVLRLQNSDQNSDAMSVRATSLREPLVVSGSADGATRLAADGRPVPLTDGRFELRYDRPPARISLTATDAVGNAVTRQVAVAVRHPGMRAVHMTALAWTSKTLREPILAQLKAKTIDAIELDVKDEDGAVGYDSAVPLAREAGAAKGHYDARQALDEIHGLGGRVVGRIVAFRDPTLGRYFWKTGKRDRLVQTPDGAPYSGKYGGFSFLNPASHEVRRYDIDLATEAARLGFDDILYDYVRRPDGKLSKLRFPGMTGTPEKVIVDFMDESRQAVRGAGAYLGASVYGIAATRPTEIAQDIPGMAEHADFISPMVYPSHWARGEYKVSNPNSQPYDIVVRSLADFRRIVQGSETSIIPWLQDFSLGVRYGPREVAAQLRGAKENSMPSFLLWNPGSRYTWPALQR